MKRSLLAVGAVCLAGGLVFAAAERGAPRTFKVTADRIAVDNVTKAAAATGHVEAVSEPAHLRSDYATRDETGLVKFHAPTELTTCTNHPGICHWSLKGEVEYMDGKYIVGRDMWLEFYEMPIFWLPYFYYPLDGECAFRIMPGYTERWGAYLMMKYVYDVFGDHTHPVDGLWAYADTRLDLRWENGIAFGQSLDWNLGTFGRGHFKLYYAWDEDYDRYQIHWNDTKHWNYQNWGSNVDRDRYLMELQHRWDVTERDVIRLKGAIASDSHFQYDFFRDNFMTIRNEWLSREMNEIAWEHNENMFGGGVSVSGPMNEFYGGTARLPEIYFDASPMPLFDIPWTEWQVNYESETRLGYLARQAAEYGSGDETSAFSFNPGLWARYATFRGDSYHRLTAPFKVEDVLAVTPRLAYRGTFWNDGGETDLTGWNSAGKHNGAMYRSIFETGVTFAGRAKGMVDDRWQHLLEPYFDVLAQEAWYHGVSGGRRPYLFDALDYSVDWQDQFAGRARNLPYSYYGVTPGIRNAWNLTDEKGTRRTVVDFDVYAAFQFRHADMYGDDDNHKLAAPGSPNYGKSDVYVSPGFRLRWFPTEDTTLRTQLEYDPDYNAISYADLSWQHRVTKDFNYYVSYSVRDYRRWDFSSTPYDATQMTSDDFNRAHFQYVLVGFEQQPIDWFAWSPFLRWDCNSGELDRCGSWFDYLTDCLGFRLILSYDNACTRIDGSEREDDFHVGFYIYLRALGASASDLTSF